MKELLILSGKGGTGKTTLANAFIELSKSDTFADCDVDAPNLDLIINQDDKPILENYYGMNKAKINNNLCIQCGRCIRNCKFDAIEYINNNFHVNINSCEGCGVCEYICPKDAISMVPNISGKTILYTGNNTFSTAKLKVGEGNSGLLVSQVKENMRENRKKSHIAIIDGSPGIGCPITASITGVDYIALVAEPSISGINDLERIILTAKNFNIKMGIIINKYNLNINNTLKIEKLGMEQGIEILGKVPYDKRVIDALNSKKSILTIDSQIKGLIEDIFKKIKENIL